MRSVNILELNR